MNWTTMWNTIYTGKSLNNTVPSHIVALLENRVSADKALHARKFARDTKYGNGERSHRNDNQALNVARFYEDYYKNCNPIPTSHLPCYSNFLYISIDSRFSKKPDTDHRNYLKKRYKPFIDVAIQAAIQTNPTPTDDDVLEQLYTALPTRAFDDAEIAIWKAMYAFVHAPYTDYVNAPYTATSKTNRNKTHTENTYSDFATWILKNKDDYTSNSRYFVSSFLAYCNKQGIVIILKRGSNPRTKIDNMLRYDAFPACFSDDDCAAIGLHSQKQRQDFFDILKLINDARKKR